MVANVYFLVRGIESVLTPQKEIADSEENFGVALIGYEVLSPRPKSFDPSERKRKACRWEMFLA
jgi:hypothetical protein